MINILKAVFGGVMLFLGRDMDWLFSLGLGLLVGQKVAADFLPEDAPLWMQIAVIVAIGAIGILPHVVYPESSYIVTGLLFGGYIFSEYANVILGAFLGTELTGSTWLIFFVGAVLGAVILGFLKKWGVMLATALVGAFLVSDLFTGLTPFLRAMVASGLFIVGGIVQIIIMRIEDAQEL